MTSEDDFQAALDAIPDDHNTRLVFADWLQERDDPRAEGYRALGVLRKHPHPDGGRNTWNYHNPLSRFAVEEPETCWLPHDWWLAIIGDDDNEHWTDDGTRREAEDAAALAFAKLPPERRAELLSGEKVVA